MKQALRRSAEKPVRASISGGMTISPSAFRRRREKGEWSENREKVRERERKRGVEEQNKSSCSSGFISKSL